MSRLDDLIEEVWSQIDSAKTEIDTMANGKGDLQSMPYIAERCREVVTLIENYDEETKRQEEEKNKLRVVGV